MNCIDHLEFATDNRVAFKTMLRTVLSLAHSAPNNIKQEYQNIKLVVPPNKHGYWSFIDEHNEMELVCTIPTYINGSTAFEQFDMISMPNNKADRTPFSENMWAEQSYNKVIDRIMGLLRPDDVPKTNLPQWMADEDEGSIGHGFTIYIRSNITYIAKNHVYYGK